MNKLFSHLSNKVSVVVATFLAVASLGATASAWYPARDTFTVAHPADHVTFNSITDNPREGDERAFFEVKDAANTQSGGFAHKTTVKDGEEVLLRVYVHNNASDTLNTVPDGNGGYKGVATNTQVRVWLPSVTDTVMRANAYVSADNALPKEVSDTVDFVAPVAGQNFSVSYVPGSAVAYNNAVGQTGMKLSDSIVTTGAKIGYNAADGVVPGCFQYVNVITLKVKVHMDTGFKVEKTVAKPGDKTWGKKVIAKPGEAVNYQITFSNTGTTTLNDVVIRDFLPAGMKIVPGTTKLYNGNYPNGTKIDTDAVASNGLAIGAYTGNSNAFVRFQATVPTESDLKCGVNTLVNTAKASTGGKEQSDTANVEVSKVCKDIPKELPHTGAGGVAGIVAATTIGSAAAYEVVTRRRAGRQ